MKQYVECIAAVNVNGYHLQHVSRGMVYRLLYDGDFAYIIEVANAKDGKHEYDKQYFRILPDIEVVERTIRKEIYG